MNVGLANHINNNGGIHKMDNQSLAHSRYNCTYHIVFNPSSSLSSEKIAIVRAIVNANMFRY